MLETRTVKKTEGSGGGTGGGYDVEEEILKRVDEDPKDTVPFLIAQIKQRLAASDAEARNMLLFSQQAVIHQLHEKVSEILSMQAEKKPAIIDVGNANQTIEIPVKDLLTLETNLQNAAMSPGGQTLNMNPMIVLQQPENGDLEAALASGGYPALQPSNMQQVLIVAPTSTTPVMKGPITLSNPQVSMACPVGLQTPQNSGMTRGAGLNSTDVNMIAKKYTHSPPQPCAEKLEELESFAREFRQRRLALGFTQGDVGLSLGKMHGSDFSQTTISRFEALNLSYKNMDTLKPYLESWIGDAERHRGSIGDGKGPLNPEDKERLDEFFVNINDPMSQRKRKRRTVLDAHCKRALEQYFSDRPHPTSEQLGAIAETLNQDRETVRVWFSNRRQKERKNESGTSIVTGVSQPTTPTVALLPSIPSIVGSNPDLQPSNLGVIQSPQSAFVPTRLL